MKRCPATGYVGCFNQHFKSIFLHFMHQAFLSQIQAIEEKIAPIKERIVSHPLYPAIQQLSDLQIFMQFHVYAVWDFMSLLKALQQHLTCTQVPWFPVGEADTRFLINEIVVGEEADVALNGERMSHFEMYLAAMSQAGAWAGISKFVSKLKQTADFETAFAAAETPVAAQNFVKFTFDQIADGKLHVLAAIFTFGREDLIPQMFLSLVNDIHQEFPNTVDQFKYYLERHIEVDGGHHGQLALQMTALLCGDDPQKWEEAAAGAEAALQARLALWDGVLAELQTKKQRTYSTLSLK